MEHTKTLTKVVLFAAIAALSASGQAQTAPTATQQLRLSAFGGLTGIYTNLEGGRNGAITAGADVQFNVLHFIRPSFEVRGTYPVKGGQIDSQKSFLLGPKVEYPFGRFHPYVDFFIGRGGIDYRNGGFVHNNVLYISSTSTIYSPGAGLDYDLSNRWALKADFQYEKWNTPVTSSGTVHPKATTFAVVYHFDFNPRHHFPKR